MLTHKHIHIITCAYAYTHTHDQAREQLAQADSERADSSGLRMELERLQHENAALTKRVQALQVEKAKANELQELNRRLQIQVCCACTIWMHTPCMLVDIHK